MFRLIKEKNIVTEINPLTDKKFKVAEIEDKKDINSFRNINGIRLSEYVKEDLVNEIPEEVKQKIIYFELINPYKKSDLSFLRQFPNLQIFKFNRALKKVSIKGLNHLKKLEMLELRNFTDIVELNEVIDQISSPLESKVLILEHFPKITNLKSIEKLRNLKVFKFDGVSIGSIPQKVKLDTLKPLGTLKDIEDLSLRSISVEDLDVSPITNYPKLKYLSLSLDIFRQQEYARLKAHYPNIHAECLNPYSEFQSTNQKGVKETNYVIRGKGKQ